MRMPGGYDIAMAGRPAGRIEDAPAPEVLRLLLRSRRLSFSRVLVEDGRRVVEGEPLAVDPEHFDTPLPAPRGGTVRLDGEGRITLENLDEAGRDVVEIRTDDPRRRLLARGAWSFVADAHTQGLPDPFGRPRAVIVSTLRLEPFGLRGDVQLREEGPAFFRGLRRLRSLAGGRSIFLAAPREDSPLTEELARAAGEGVEILPVPRRYPADHFRLLAGAVGLKAADDEAVWAMRVEGVLAIERALGADLPCVERVVAVGGPGAAAPTHLRTIVGCPIEMLLTGRAVEGAVRIVNGGALTGTVVDAEGLDVECTALTLLPEPTAPSVLAWARPGADRRSYSGAFLSSLRRRFAERLTTALRGEQRPCVACGYCERVCPAGLMPHVLHKGLSQDLLEEVYAAGLDRCVECGLCSYVCPSKIDLRRQFIDAKDRIARELGGGEGMA